jgi:hypothetical protein
VSSLRLIPIPGTAVHPSDRNRVLLLMAAFAFEVILALWVLLVAPAIHADPAQGSPHARDDPLATRAVKVWLR